MVNIEHSFFWIDQSVSILKHLTSPSPSDSVFIPFK